MIKRINILDTSLAKKILILQRKAYFIECELIKYYDIPSLKENLPQLMLSLESFIVFEQGFDILGMLSYEIQDDVLTICRLTTDPKYFRQGIAEELMRYIDKIECVKCVKVSTALLNFPAIKFYEKLGFLEISQSVIDDKLVLIHFKKEKY
jgi:ribosomal protein S18 acetylase RimI-like enzyme